MIVVAKKKRSLIIDLHCNDLLSSIQKNVIDDRRFHPHPRDKVIMIVVARQKGHLGLIYTATLSFLRPKKRSLMLVLNPQRTRRIDKIRKGLKGLCKALTVSAKISARDSTRVSSMVSTRVSARVLARVSTRVAVEV